MIKHNSNFIFKHERILCSQYTQTFAGVEQAHFYVIDLTQKETRETVLKTGLLTNAGFEIFSNTALRLIFGHQRGVLQQNLNMVFLLPEGMELTSDMEKLQEDFQYMRKLFLRPSEFEKIILEDRKREICSVASVGTEKYKIRNFNVLSESDQRINLEFLKLLSGALKSTIVKVGPFDSQTIEKIQTSNRKLFAFYYQKLWSMFQELGVPKDFTQLSFLEQHCLSLASILSVQTKKQPLFLSGIDWKILDNNRRLNFISTLSDFSEQSGSVFVTCENERDISLIKQKVYRANFMSPK